MCDKTQRAFVRLKLFVFLSELVGPWPDAEGTGCGGDRDVAAEEEVFLLRPECGLQRPCPAQPALRTGTRTANIDKPPLLVSLFLLGRFCNFSSSQRN